MIRFLAAMNRFLAGRWGTAFYLLTIAVAIGSAWFVTSQTTLRVSLSVGFAAAGSWFLLYQTESRFRQRFAAASERIMAAEYPCPVCGHYACDEGSCLSCGGLCATPADQSYWLN